MRRANGRQHATLASIRLIFQISSGMMAVQAVGCSNARGVVQLGSRFKPVAPARLMATLFSRASPVHYGLNLTCSRCLGLYN